MQSENQPETSGSDLNPPTQTMQELLEIEQLMERSESPLPEAAVKDFPGPIPPVMFSSHAIRPAKARDAVLAAFAAAAPALPKGVRAERVADTLRPVFVPYWSLSGEISGQWNATGIETESWQVDCPNCLGSGKVGTGAHARDCETCWGSGKEKQTRKNRHPESGGASAVVRDALDNNGSGVALSLNPDAAAPSWRLPADVRARLRCLRPASLYSSGVADALKNRLAVAIDEQAKGALTKYSRIEGFLFLGETVRSASAVAVWLYPAYLGWFEADGARHVLVCDALTGQVSVVQGPADAEGTTSRRSSSPKALAAIAAAVIAALGAAAWFFLKR